MARRIRVLHCPTTVGGNPPGLARAERELGLESISVAITQNYLNYEADEVLCAEGDKFLRREGQRWNLLRRALREFDVIHFNFGSSILSNRVPAHAPRLQKYPWVMRIGYAVYSALLEQRDLAWLSRAGKGIVVTYQGDDARQGDVCLERFEITAAREVEEGYYQEEGDRFRRRRIARFSQYADRIYSVNPDLLHVLPDRAEFVPYASVDPRDWVPTGHPPGSSSRPVVVHAPSHRGVKGTRFVLDAVRKLQEQDKLDFEFVLVEGLPHQEARKHYERADLLVDQLLVGWYGALAVELMSLGKPTVCYVRQDDLRFIPEEMRQELPTIQATSETIYSVLKSCLTTRRGELALIGQRSRAYAQKWHEPLRIAAKLKRDYEDIVNQPRKPGHARDSKKPAELAESFKS